MNNITRSIAKEAIAFQGKGFFDALTQAITELRSSSQQAGMDTNYYELPEAKGVCDVVQRYTGLNLTMAMIDSRIEVGIWLPPIRNGHIFDMAVGKYSMNSQLGADLKHLFKQNKDGFLKGMVDIRENRVSGFFAQLPYLLHIHQLVLHSDQFTDQELAACVLHEIGHAFTQCEYINRTVLTNQVLAGIASAVTGGEADKIKSVVMQASSELGFNKKQTAAMLQAKEMGDYVVCAYALADEICREELGYSVYSTTSCEQLADQYASRCGAGRHLITALSKSYDRFGNYGYSKSRTIMQAVGSYSVVVLGASMWGAAMGGGLLALIAAIAAGWFRGYSNTKKAKPAIAARYDDPVDRLKRIRQDTIQLLKDDQLAPELLKSVVNELEESEKIILSVIAKEPYDKTRNLWHYALLFFNGVYSKQFDMELLQKQLESLAANNLFVQAAKFKTH